MAKRLSPQLEIPAVEAQPTAPRVVYADEKSPRLPTATIVAQGKLLDYIDGITQRDETPEEYVRQEMAKSLVREYRYSKSDVKIELGLKVGSRKPRADIALFQPGDAHTQLNVWIIVECKEERVSPGDRKEGIDQLKSYLAVCPNAKFGMWTNQKERLCLQRQEVDGKVDFVIVPDIPEAGHDAASVERPRIDLLKPALSDALLFLFARSHNYIAANQGLQKPEAFWELLKLIWNSPKKRDGS